MTQPAGIGAARAAGPALRADHPYGKPFTGTGDPAVGRGADPRRAGPLPPELDPARQCDHLRGRRPAARRARAAARSALRQLAGARGAARDQGVHRRHPGAAAADRADRPAAIAAVASSSPAQLLPAEGTEDLLDLDRRQRGARRQLPVADQHGPARAARLVLRRARQRQPASSTRCPTSSRRRSRPTRPASRSPRRSRWCAASSATSGVTPSELQPDRSPATPASCRASSRPRRRSSARCARTRSTAGRTIIGRRSPTAIAA